ncbi:MAG: hypothetical protein SOY60_06835 [Fusobacterium gastrosuis]|uniref:hypothetical protein n=1 Tax=Fusobacterium gastrosuis TaxID=1755100 RepID=UPI002A8A8482|nr:hypothetical protein [Fusobacterium gastrosuis]MDY5795485.1 hypothetical protein [Fusobacterium gastrosuis]
MLNKLLDIYIAILLMILNFLCIGDILIFFLEKNIILAMFFSFIEVGILLMSFGFIKNIL